MIKNDLPYSCWRNLFLHEKYKIVHEKLKPKPKYMFQRRLCPLKNFTGLNWIQVQTLLMISVAQLKHEVQPKINGIYYGLSKLRLKIHGKKFLTCNNVPSLNSKALSANLQPSSTFVDRESTHPPPRAVCNLIFPTSSSHCAWQFVIRAFINVSPPSLRSLVEPNNPSKKHFITN